jgi:hypothetical protein
MEALRETTGGLFPAHVYLLDGNNLVSYIKKGETAAFYFKNPIKGFDKRGRKFEVVNPNPFKQLKKASHGHTVIGSSGQVYTVTEDSCSCAGFTYRGSCKHLGQHG